MSLLSSFARVLGALLLVATFTSSARSEPNWPRWRGPNENGHTSDKDVPLKWSEGDLAWKTALPGKGQSSPVVWGDKIFLTAALENGKERVVFCVSRTDGKILWQQSAWTGEPEPIHAMNSWASSTCVTDGEVVIAFFGRGGMHAYTVDGKLLWTKDLGRFEGPWGTSACPILVDNMVIQNCDADVNAYLISLDKNTGDEIWKTKRREHRGWSTPIIINSGSRREMVLNGHEGVQGYDPATGKELWFCKGFAGRGEPTVTPAGGWLCVVNGQPGDFYCVKPGGDGDVTDSHMAWHTPRKSGRDCPSPIVIGKYVIVCSLDGIASCYDAVDGHVYWKERIAGKFSASPIAANGLAYFLNEAGKTYAIEPGEALKIVAESEIPAGKDEIFRSSLAPVQGQLFIRSTTTLYCVGKK
ncbi:outer membrane biogenesis protein BamB [Anatilimnocola aggregata]|uniref:Outer membrane biogenesis protein BamB n=1 Tax=Anatilimnocola aggregata TaxID=2528021 RepID=A0A517YIJ9_9BACT|nr:PQQ-binding-like beta-propeller repeat protein [Anatilimnocola aggregata]QDU30048.1 outer membrane biogenesis protein BamB [Anatilimnocola aggregata]